MKRHSVQHKKNLQKIILVFCVLFGFSGCGNHAEQKINSVSKNLIEEIKHKHSVSYIVHLFPIADLPSEISESSGLVMSSPNSLWTHNDSRGEPKIFNLDTLGNLRRAITFTNEPNIDWEEITKDEKGNFYVGDFGNNDCKRHGLRINKFSNPDLDKTDSIAAQDIDFSYPDQLDFPPSIEKMNFDAEAMVAFNNVIYLFSKNRTDPYTGYSKLYELPAIPGNHVAQLVDSLYTGKGPVKECSITGAAINDSHTILVLISHEKIWVFTHFVGNKFLDGNMTELSFSEKGLSMEGVCFKSENELYLTEERSEPGSGKLFYLDLSGILKLQ